MIAPNTIDRADRAIAEEAIGAVLDNGELIA